MLPVVEPFVAAGVLGVRMTGFLIAGILGVAVDGVVLALLFIKLKPEAVEAGVAWLAKGSFWIGALVGVADTEGVAGGDEERNLLSGRLRVEVVDVGRQHAPGEREVNRSHPVLLDVVGRWLVVLGVHVAIRRDNDRSEPLNLRQ